MSARTPFEVIGYRLEPYASPAGRCVVGLWWVTKAGGHVGLLHAEPWSEEAALKAWLFERARLEEAWHSRGDCYGEPG